MNQTRRRLSVGAVARYALGIAALGLGLGTQAAQLNLNVVDGAGNPVSGFRWVLQEDTTFVVDPANPPPITEQLGLNFHKSYHPIAQSGNTDASALSVAVPAGRYYVSVLPYSGHAMGGAPVDLSTAAAANVAVTVEEHPIPTAQIAIYLFHDCYPLNGAPDLPEEEAGSTACPWVTPDFTQFRVVIEEPAGKYGANGGPLLQDAFGNPLGTTYNPNGTVKQLGDGTLIPNADGSLLVKNLAPGKYGVIITTPTGSGWTQTSTIEGTPVIDAWVKANEPPFMVEFGLPGPHVFVGFTQARNDLAGGTATVSGTITDMHMSRPPETQLYSGRPFPQCWVAINEGGAVPGMNRYAMPCNADSTFSIPNVPPGAYEMKVFDTPLDVIIATMAFTVDEAGTTCNGGQSCDFDNVPVFNWFNRLTTYVFSDVNQNGFWDEGEPPLGAESGPVNVRWRDGTVYQSFPTDTEGLAPFDESFPWFHWMVAEVGFTNKKATGATVVVDAGGPVDTSTDAFPGYGELTPQPQSENGGLGWRTETGPVLLEAFQGFLGQTNVIHFGKAEYLNYDFSNLPATYVGENGGITGIVFNTVTRAENDPRYAVGEGWEPGVPRVQVNLYADGDIDSPHLGDATAFPNGVGDVDWNGDGIYQADDNAIDDVNGDGSVTLADVDNYPLGWASGGTKGLEDIDRNGNGSFDLGDALAVAWTDSWDDNTPTGCQGQNNLTAIGVADDRCFDGMRNWNQVRPGVFDGGYAFAGYDLDYLQTVRPTAAAKIQAFYDYVNGSVDPGVAATLQLGLLPSDYIVEATQPPGYKALREHHKNVDFGDEYQPAPAALPPVCVGQAQPVPPYFAILTKDGSGQAAQLIDLANAGNPDAAAPFGGEDRPVCDFKKVPLNGAQNAAADFFLVSDVPVAANVTGFVLNDLANEFNPNTPSFGEKYAPPLIPVGFYDWAGKQVNRVYGDEYGRYNALVPSTWNANLPMPSGVSPNMLVACMNDAGPILSDPTDPNSPKIVDPYFNPAFSQFCYTFQYMPGSTTYLDTPVVAIAAFTNPVSYPVDCEVPQFTPMVRDVTSDRGGPIALAGETIQIRSMGDQPVTNPEWDGVDPATRFITRDLGFGTTGTVQLEAVDGIRTAFTGVTWGNDQISASVPAGVAPGEYQVVVTRMDGATPVEAEIGVTLTVGVANGGVFQGLRPNGEPYSVWNVPGDFATIQAAIDGAAPGDMILVEPGEYNELVVMWKPVKLQGWGAGSVVLNARQTPTEKVDLWRAKIDDLLDGRRGNGEISLLPGQTNNVGGFPSLGAPAMATEEGAGIVVAGVDTTLTGGAGRNRFNLPSNRGARIDGFHILGASQGGGIVVNGYAPYLNIGNNRVEANSGFYGGGIRVGHPGLTADEVSYTDAVNDWVRIHHNQVVKNGATAGAGGGISLYTGADQYRVQNNWVCGNFSQGHGGGIAQQGRSDGGVIERNDVLFNESFSQATSVHGGGIYVGGETPLGLTNGLLLSEGTGNVTINANRINGNLAGAGDGGGIAIVSANGLDVVNSQDEGTLAYNNSLWWDVNVFNNMITNNVAGLAGAVTLQDSLEVHIQNNTIAHNESTATAALAFTAGNQSQSNPLPAGVVSRIHSVDMGSLLLEVPDGNIPVNGAGRLDPYRTYSDPNLNNDIVLGNRSFFWLNYGAPGTVTSTGLFPANCTTAPTGCNLAAFWGYTADLAVLDGITQTGDTLFVRANLLTNDASNRPAYNGAGNRFTRNPMFVNAVFNEGQDGVDIPEFTVLQTAAAFDEGGNFIQVVFSPLSISELGSHPSRVLYDYHITAGSRAVDNGQNVPATSLLGRDFDGETRPNGGDNDIGADEL